MVFEPGELKVRDKKSVGLEYVGEYGQAQIQSVGKDKLKGGCQKVFSHSTLFLM